jgi:hypothetical protein
MDPPSDSIDGLGFTFSDLKPASQLLAIFRVVQRTQLTDAQRGQIKAALTNAKAMSDQNQRVLQSLTTPPPTES